MFPSSWNLFWALLLMRASTALFGVTGAKIKDVLYGYISTDPTNLSIPRYILKSDDMTAVKCADVCGISKMRFAAILNNTCSCTNDLLNSTIIANCQSQLSCPGDSSEVCGCTSSNLQIVYDTGYSTTYVVRMYTGLRKQDSFSGNAFVQLFGPDMRETDEGRLMPITMQSSSTAEFNYPVRDLKGIVKLRIGHNEPTDDWHLVRIDIIDPSSLTIYSTSVDLLLSPSNIMVADVYTNGSIVKPEQGKDYYSLEKGPPWRTVACINGTENGCFTNDTTKDSDYVKFSGFFYKRIVLLSNLNFTYTNDCVIPLLDSSVVVTRTSFGVGSTVKLDCRNGYFLDGNVTMTSMTLKCGMNGAWSKSDIPNCGPVCKAVAPPNSMSWNWNGNLYVSAGQGITYFCTQGAFDGYGTNQVTVTCLSNGTWSLTSIPGCVVYINSSGSQSNSSSGNELISSDTTSASTETVMISANETYFSGTTSTSTENVTISANQTYSSGTASTSTENVAISANETYSSGTDSSWSQTEMYSTTDTYSVTDMYSVTQTFYLESSR